MIKRTTFLALALLVTGCTTSILGGGLPKAPTDSIEIRQAKADKAAEDAIVARVAKLLRAGETPAEVVEVLVAAGYTEPTALRYVALARLR